MRAWRGGPAGLLLPVALLLPWAHGSLAIACGRIMSAPFGKPNVSRIIGGEAANITNFPWQVSIFNLGKHHCGGTILSEWWILSASHCFKRVNRSNLMIVLGIDDLHAKKVMEVKVDMIIMHHHFDTWILDNDIALLLVRSPLSLNAKRIPICLSEVTDIRRWSSCWVTGWHSNTTNSTQLVSSKLKKVQLELFEWKTCYHIFPVFTKNMICAGHSQEGRDACQGDSGGPLVCHKKKNSTVWYQLGIVSWGLGCGKKGFPGVYTKVSNYLKWIRKVTARIGRPYQHQPDSGCGLLLSPWAVLFQCLVMLLMSW